MLRKLAVIGLLVAGVVASGCSSDSKDDLAENVAENAGGVDNLELGGSGQATVGGETIDFEVATCIEQEGNAVLASADADPAVAVDAATGSIAVSTGEDNYAVSDAEIAVEDGQLTATGSTEAATVDGAPVTEAIEVEVTADC